MTVTATYLSNLVHVENDMTDGLVITFWVVVAVDANGKAQVVSPEYLSRAAAERRMSSVQDSGLACPVQTVDQCAALGIE